VKQNQQPFVKIRLTALVGVSLFFMATACTAVYYRYRYLREKNTLHTYANKLWTPGEIIIDDRFAFSFESVRTSTVQVPHFWELPANSRFVIVRLSFKNNMKSVFHMSPIASMHLSLGNGSVVQVSSAPDIKEALGGPVESGKTVSGEVGFIVPADIKDADLIFDTKLPDAHLIRVAFSVPS
jgi:hypothetical protein